MSILHPQIHLQQYFSDVAAQLQKIGPFSVFQAVEILRLARERHARVWIAGNGGSAATASHFSTDLRKIAAVDTTAMMQEIPMVTAYGNDEGWHNMLANCLVSAFKPEDVFFAISFSGRSENVIRAARMALNLGGILIILTGPKNMNVLAGYDAQAIISVDNPDIRIVEDCHLAICHAIAGRLAEDMVVVHGTIYAQRNHEQ